MTRYLWIAIIPLMVACIEPRVVYVPTKLGLPDEPPIPKVSSEDLQCLSDEAYTQVVERDRVCRTQVKALKAVICSTNDDC